MAGWPHTCWSVGPIRARGMVVVDGLREPWWWLWNAGRSGTGTAKRGGWAVPRSSRATAAAYSHARGSSGATASWKTPNAAAAGKTSWPSTPHMVPLVLNGRCQSCRRQCKFPLIKKKQKQQNKIYMAMLLTFQFYIGVSVCLSWYPSLTIEEIALVLQYLANLEHPDLTDSGTHWMKGVSLQVATRRSGGKCELAGIFWIFL